MALHRGHLRRPCYIIRHEKRFFRPRRPFESYGPKEIPLLSARRIACQIKRFSFHECFPSNRCYFKHDETIHEKAIDGYGKIEIMTHIPLHSNPVHHYYIDYKMKKIK